MSDLSSAYREIALGAADIFERAAVIERSDQIEPRAGVSLSDDAEAQWDAWRETFDSPAAFETRLERCPYRQETLERAFTLETWPEDVSLPEWITHLDRILDSVSETQPSAADDRVTDADSELPFEPLVAVLVQFGRQRVVEATDYDLLERAAKLDAERWLAHRVTNVLAQPLHVRLQTRIALEDPSHLPDSDQSSFDAPSSEYYDAFVEDLFDDGLTDVFSVYPVAARQLVQVLDQWVEFVGKFCDAFATDRPQLQQQFGIDPDTTVTTLELGLGDSHGGGQTVAKVTTADETVLAFKPRDLDIEASFFEFLDELDDAEIGDRFPTPTIVTGDAYGWMEWFTPEPCESEAGVERYYRRAGDLLAVLYLLGASDCHFENLVAAGEQPVLVDAESVIHPNIDLNQMPTEQPRKNRVTAAAARDTVLKTGLLPWYAETTDDDELGGLEAGDVSGFSAADPDEIVLSQLRWQQVNTDQMAAEYVRPSVSPSDHLPHVDGEPAEVQEYVSEVVSGFERTYDQLESLLAETTMETGPLAVFENVSLRLFFRSTRLYQALVNRLAIPASQRSGIEQTQEWETLAANLVNESSVSALFGLYEAERESLAQLDVPRFETAFEANAIEWDGDVYATDVLEQPAADLLRDRCAALGPDDRRHQTEYIKLSLGALQTSDDRHETEDAGTVGLEERNHTPDLEVASIQKSIVETLQSRALSIDGNPTWVRKEFHGGDNQLALQQLNPWLYNGRGGIGLALASYGADGHPEADEFATAVLEPLLDGPPAQWRDALLGSGVGIGSVLYSLTVAGELLDDDRFQSRADDLVSWLTAEQIAADTHFDVVQGCAGLALALLAYADRSGTHRDVAREIAGECGEHLVAQRVEYEGWQVWDTMPEMTTQPAIGFSHGQSGIAYALARLGDTIDRPAFTSAARTAFDYEDAFFDSERANWPDVRTVGGRDRRYLDSWCYGRGGMVLARVRTRQQLDGEPRETTQQALSHYRSPSLSTSDHLCCGNFGTVAILLDIASVTGEPMYRDLAVAYTEAVLERREDASFRFRAWAGDVYDPSLFLGSSGILYTLQRLASPDEAGPSLLVWE